MRSWPHFEACLFDHTETEGDEERESGSKLLEHDLMALYSHSPYLGEWGTFLKIGDALKAQYGRLEPLNRDDAVSAFGHDDGVSFGDLYRIGKDSEIDISSELPVPMPSSLKFELKPIESMQLRFKALRDDKGSNESSSSSSSWFGDGGSVENTEWIEMVDGDGDGDVDQLSLCRLGAVKKTQSFSQCVPRVQGPIFNDDRLRMRGSAVLMAPSRRRGGGPMDSVIPKEVELNGVADFVQIRQIEEWRLEPVEKGNVNELSGTVTVRREPVGNDTDSEFKAFEIEYDAKVKLSAKTLDYF